MTTYESGPKVPPLVSDHHAGLIVRVESPLVRQSFSLSSCRFVRSRDDLDIERMLKPRDAPDVVRSTYGGERDTGEHQRHAAHSGHQQDYSIDNLFGIPAKISIPERYVPEQVYSFSSSSDLNLVKGQSSQV